ncbi:hypothetical protein GOV14_03980 [Candidatus Pacearchaeota archaeon]|nr:hypothetical protein [Candidatus Pacearchaeota archaeon]
MSKKNNKFQKRLEAMTDDKGIVQHSDLHVPNPKYDYSIDDQARALIIKTRTDPSNKILNLYLDYLIDAKRNDGWFNNYKTEHGKWEARNGKQEDSGDLQDCYGRTIWALAELLGKDCLGSSKQKKVRTLFFDSLEMTENLQFPMSKALASIGLSKYLAKSKNDSVKSANLQLVCQLQADYHKHSDKDWKGFSTEYTYCGPRLAQAMILAGQSLTRPDLTEIGKQSLHFLIKHTIPNKFFRAIGNKGWFQKGSVPSLLHEQSIEAGVMAEACVDAGLDKQAQIAFSWFHGNNSINHDMRSQHNSIYDAITETGVNKNQGAESIISYLMACSKMQ